MEAEDLAGGPSGPVAGVILAAGSSSRLGVNKLLIELDGETVVRRAARRALEAGLSPVIVVLGFEARRVAAALEGLAVETVVNRRHDEGMHASVEVGLERVPAECAAAVVILADMPLVTAGMLDQIVARFRSGGPPLVISLYGEVQAPPTLYSRALFPALAAAGAGGGRQVVGDHREQAAALHWPNTVGADLDLPEDVARLRQELPSGGPAS
ncbi:MAG: nucleotidyltransferase family protein [Gemmatimonadales bacterium]|nr:nucleotidyltransferase family protein [Gemmatimonadales bacterium]MBA3554807.1 nucleotidyltransferase family protein [Gemmatimonadales bacterium]